VRPCCVGAAAASVGAARCVRPWCAARCVSTVERTKCGRTHFGSFFSLSLTIRGNFREELEATSKSGFQFFCLFFFFFSFILIMCN
jgi:hypothetical protein